MKRKLKAYFWKECEDADTGLGVVHYTLKEAKGMAYDYWGSDVGHNEDFIEQRIKRIKTADISKFTEPTVVWDLKQGLKSGFYSRIEEDTDCEECFKSLSYVNADDVVGDKIICEDCREKRRLKPKEVKAGSNADSHDDGIPPKDKSLGILPTIL